MERIPDEIIQQMFESLKGKRIYYKGIAGTCEYFGYSFFESWGLQLTINRLPISNINLQDIKLIVDGKIQDWN